MFFQKPCYREILAMRGRIMRGLPVAAIAKYDNGRNSILHRKKQRS